MSKCSCRGGWPGMPPCSCGVGESPTTEGVGAKRHKWADVIIAFAEGKAIQFRRPDRLNWHDYLSTSVPNFHENWEYRIKPIPKPDIVRYGRASFTEYNQKSPVSRRENSILTFTSWTYQNAGGDNLKVTFDGETHELKSVEIVK